MAEDWQMPRRSETCAGCGRAFEVQELFQAFLYASRDGYERRDYCRDCHPPAAPPAIGSWKTRRPEPAAKRIRPFDREAIYDFFQRLEDVTDPAKVQFRFVVALLLWRKKVLKFARSEHVGGREVWHFDVPNSRRTHSVVRPDLDEQQVERLSAQLGRLLAGEPGVPKVVIADAGPEYVDD